jgi:hypothetical protein
VRDRNPHRKALSNPALPPGRIAYARRDDPTKTNKAQAQGSKKVPKKGKSEGVLPVMSLIHENLQSAWKINERNELCFIFDSHSPARQFQRGTQYSDDLGFPEPGRTTPDNLTETDEPDGGLMPYMARSYSYAPPCLNHQYPRLT